MRTGKSVQFRNVDDILTAYNSRGVASYALFQEKQFLFKYEGDDLGQGAAELETMLNCLRQSSAIYTLAVYEEYQGKLTSETPYHGSFNFRFQENTDGNYGGSSALHTLTASVETLAARIEQMEAEKEDEPEGAISGMDQIAGILAHPLVQQLAPVVLGALGMGKDGKPAAIAGAFDPKFSRISDELREAVGAMVAASPDAEPALIALGRIAKSDPAKFKTLLGYMTLI